MPHDHHDRHDRGLAGRRVLVEFDNTRDDANHVHALWRDLAADWGDALAAHDRTGHLP